MAGARRRPRQPNAEDAPSRRARRAPRKGDAHIQPLRKQWRVQQAALGWTRERLSAESAQASAEGGLDTAAIAKLLAGDRQSLLGAVKLGNALRFDLVYSIVAWARDQLRGENGDVAFAATRELDRALAFLPPFRTSKNARLQFLAQRRARNLSAAEVAKKVSTKAGAVSPAAIRAYERGDLEVGDQLASWLALLQFEPLDGQRFAKLHALGDTFESVDLEALRRLKKRDLRIVLPAGCAGRIESTRTAFGGLVVERLVIEQSRSRAGNARVRARHRGFEIVIVASGRIRAAVGEDSFVLDSGRSIAFDSGSTHEAEPLDAGTTELWTVNVNRSLLLHRKLGDR